MVTKKLTHHPFVARLRAIPKRTYILISAAIIVTLYLIFFVVPRTVRFSYAAPKTCMAQLTLLPGLQKTIDDSKFTVSSESGPKIGGLWLMSTKTCVTPTAAPIEGTSMVAAAPLGSVIFRHHLAVKVANTPTLSNMSLKKPLPVSKPLTVALSAPDAVYRYTMSAGGKTAECRPQNSGVSCDVPSLKLEQGKQYTTTINRQFQSQKATSALTADLTTLTATSVTDSSVKPDETVFARPKEFTFTTDKPLKSATLTLMQRADGKETPIKIATSVDKTTVTGRLDDELERENDYTLVVSQLEASDGSALVEPYQVAFRTSGGPKVTGVNIGKTGVGLSAQVIVTFDQELSGIQDIGKLVTFTGGTASVARSGNQIIYRLQGLPRCAPFTLAIAKGVASKYDLTSKDAWSYASRTTCYTVSTYGTSLRGRALTAYHFGSSGPVTMYVGAIHGDEASSSGLMKAWVDDLEANPMLLDGRQIVVVPTINPDGVAAGTRNNARNVNLSRNFPTSNWTKDINDTNGSNPGGGGAEPLSEPEAKALANLTSATRPRLLLSFHAIGSMAIGDPGGYSAGYAARYASMVGYRNATGQGGTFDYDITGSYEDWTYQKLGIPSMVVELGSYSYFNFPHHRAALRAMLQ